MEINKMSSGEKLQRQPEDRTPFREPMRDFEGQRRIKEFENNPNKLVRMKYVYNTLKQVEEEVARFREAENVFRDFSEKCGIPVVRVDMVIGEDQGRPALFEVVDRVDGPNCQKMQIDHKNVVELTAIIDTLYSKLVGYYSEKYAQGGLYLEDLSGSQFVYGKKAGDISDRVYLVDVDPFVSEYNAEDREDPENITMLSRMKFLALCIDSLEKRLYGLKLVEARKEFGRFLGILIPSDAHKRVMEETKEVLSRGDDTM